MTQSKRYKRVSELPAPTADKPVIVEMIDLPAYLRLHGLAVVHSEWSGGMGAPVVAQTVRVEKKAGVKSNG